MLIIIFLKAVAGLFKVVIIGILVMFLFLMFLNLEELHLKFLIRYKL